MSNDDKPGSYVRVLKDLVTELEAENARLRRELSIFKGKKGDACGSGKSRGDSTRMTSDKL